MGKITDFLDDFCKKLLHGNSNQLEIEKFQEDFSLLENTIKEIENNISLKNNKNDLKFINDKYTEIMAILLKLEIKEKLVWNTYTTKEEKEFKELEKNFYILKEKLEEIINKEKELKRIKREEEEKNRKEFEKAEWIKFEKNQEKNLETIKRLLEKIRKYIGENKNVKEFYNLDKLFKDVLREVTLMKGALIFKNELTEEQVENFTIILKELEKIVEELKLYK